ncbi:hypothetical protein SBOR_9018 [Sclerotinia borealis F-4128]|uniref:Uncharacterized protein n=1 Tax=Sclerotinia borealis (strain F-4128) TaxID=1432307 RepID=W9C6S2_SCLBF|nr:hypothetical protein SBOR_9018 [Sclerotinia borealis F-4128]
MEETSVSIVLEQCESLTYNERTKQMLKLGRQSTTNPSVRSTIYKLLDGSVYEQKLVLDSCYGSQDVDLAIQYISHASPSKWLQTRAMHLIELLGTDEQILQALEFIPLKLQIKSLGRLKNAKRWRRLKTKERVIDQYLDNINDKEESALFRQLLPLSSLQYVSENLPRLVAKLSEKYWLKLATHYPVTVQAHLEHWIESSELDSPILLGIANSIISKWTKRRPDSALKLAELMVEKFPISRLPLQKLLSTRPHACMKLILENDDTALESLYFDNGILKCLSPEHILVLFEHRIITSWDFKTLTHEQRSVLYPVIRNIWRSEAGVLDITVVSHLPNPYRIEEAHRHIALSTYQTKPSDRIPYIGLLPWKEGLEFQKPFLHSRDADIRSSALSSQLEGAMYNEDYISDALDLVIRYKNDQDPIRRSMLMALSKIPGGRWNEEHLPLLAQIFRHALEASDLSHFSIDYIHEILSRLLTWFPEWTASQIVLFVKGGKLQHYDMFSHASGKFAPSMIMRIIQTALSPTLQDLSKKNDLSTLLILADLFSDHLGFWTEILDIFERAIDPEESKDHDNGSKVLQFLQRHHRATFFRIAPQLLEPKSMRFIDAQLIVRHILIHRQDLVPRLFTYHNSGSQRELLWPRLCFGDWPWTYRTWTQKQQEEFASILESRMETEDSIHQNSLYIRTLGLLNYTDPRILMHLTTSSNPVMYENATKALAKFETDAGHKSILLLLKSSDADQSLVGDVIDNEQVEEMSKKAKVAAYSLQYIIQSMSTTQAFNLLTGILRQRVTIAKEIFRLIGTLETEKAYQFLLSISTAENLHPDSYGAILQALAHETYLSKHQTWDVYKIAASKNSSNNTETQQSLLAILASFFSIPAIISNPSNIQNILEMCLTLLSSPSIELHIQTLKTLSMKPRLPFEISELGFHSLQSRLLELIQSRNVDEQKATARLIYKIFARKSSSKIISDIFKPLTTAMHMIPWIRNSLKILFDEYMLHIGLQSVDTRTLLSTTSVVLGHLQQCDITVKMKIRLIFTGFAISFPELKMHLLEMVEKEELVGDALVLASGQLGHWAENKGKETQVEELEGLLKNLKKEGAGEGAGRRLGLVCLEKGARRWGWSEKRKERLSSYKEDRNGGSMGAMIREAAWDIRVPGEIHGEDST